MDRISGRLSTGFDDWLTRPSQSSQRKSQSRPSRSSISQQRQSQQTRAAQSRASQARASTASHNRTSILSDKSRGCGPDSSPGQVAIYVVDLEEGGARPSVIGRASNASVPASASGRKSDPNVRKSVASEKKPSIIGRMFGSRASNARASEVSVNANQPSASSDRRPSAPARLSHPTEQKRKSSASSSVFGFQGVTDQQKRKSILSFFLQDL